MMLPVLVSSCLGIMVTSLLPVIAKVVRAAWGNESECELQHVVKNYRIIQSNLLGRAGGARDIYSGLTAALSHTRLS